MSPFPESGRIAKSSFDDGTASTILRRRRLLAPCPTDPKGPEAQVRAEIEQAADDDPSPAVDVVPPPPGRRGASHEYAHLTPVLVEFANLSATDPRHRELEEALLSAFLPVVRNIARRYRDSGEPLADLEQVGAIGLLGALKRFDPGTGNDFLSFAVPTITGEIKRHFRDRSWAMHVPRPIKDLQSRLHAAVEELSTTSGQAPRPSQIAAHLGVSTAKILDALDAQQTTRSSSLDEHLAGSDTALSEFLGHPDTGFELAEHRSGLRSALTALSPRERHILGLRFFEDLSQTQIAMRVGISQMHVSRTLAKSLATLRRSPALNHQGS
ncbi:SigB/SigF/SigG family RNA polymerase sigma factor [Pseudonocardia petroleophila]